MNYESAFSSHLGAIKTEFRIYVLVNFFWPGTCFGQDYTRTSLDSACAKEQLRRVLSRSVAVDIIGLIIPLSEAGHLYILTLVD